ncbi:MAG TPA: hypothetical protein VKU19_08745 [Bryobacteraceae bacterium]|nr:hypothetical protein [Bryobacteraceae bacterium]
MRAGREQLFPIGLPSPKPPESLLNLGSVRCEWTAGELSTEGQVVRNTDAEDDRCLCRRDLRSNFLGFRVARDLPS